MNEHNFYSHMNEEHTPINPFDHDRSFYCRDDATMISTKEGPEGFPHSGASSSSKQTAASRVPTLLGSLGASLWKQWRDHESVDRRTGMQETGTNVDRKSVVATFFSSHSKGREIERDRKSPENLQKIHERKVDLAVREGEWLSKNCLKLRREVGRGEILTSFFVRSIKNLNLSRFQLHRASRWADQAPKDKISLYGELEMRNTLLNEDHERDCREIEEQNRHHLSSSPDCGNTAEIPSFARRTLPGVRGSGVQGFR